MQNHASFQKSGSFARRPDAVWFCFQNNSVQGPLTLDNVLGLNSQGHDGKETLISRKDFRRWYTLREIKPLLKGQSSLNRESSADLEHFHRVLHSNLSNLENLTGLGALHETRDEPQVQATPQTPKTPAIDISHAHFDYYLVRGRLRLGQIQNPMTVAFLKWPLSLGFFWYSWLKINFVELLWHGFNRYTYRGLLPPLVFAMIPGLHFYYALKLSILLRNVEKQNGYQKTSRVLALILAAFPPFYMLYIQKRVNHHWRSHVTQYNIEAGKKV